MSTSSLQLCSRRLNVLHNSLNERTEINRHDELFNELLSQVERFNRLRDAGKINFIIESRIRSLLTPAFDALLERLWDIAELRLLEAKEMLDQHGPV